LISQWSLGARRGLTLFGSQEVETHWSIDWQAFDIPLSQMLKDYPEGISILVDILKESPVTPAVHPPGNSFTFEYSSSCLTWANTYFNEMSLTYPNRRT
jgi:hypothetical protein